MSGDVSSSYAFGLPDIDGLRGPTGDALYWVQTYNGSELFSRKRYGVLFTSVVWTEGYPQSEARAVRLEDSVARVRERLLEHRSLSMKVRQSVIEFSVARALTNDAFHGRSGG
jgi:hypothetical protein